jgi:tetratricopeptide (TPR) repeat protein
VLYDALGEFENALRELKLASTLDPTDAGHDYALYAIYNRKPMLPEQREVLLDALEKDPNNPVGRFASALVLEKEKHWADSLGEYQTAKLLVAKVKGPRYTDPRGNSYHVDGLREEVDEAIGRIAKLNDSAQHQK